MTSKLALNKTGLDGTYYSIESVGDTTSRVEGFYNVFATEAEGNQTISVGFDADTMTPGIKSGVVRIDNLDVTANGGAGRVPMMAMTWFI